MGETVKGVGHAKLILSGEHAVVYGHPAIAMAVNRTVTVTLHSRPGPTKLSAADIQDERLHQAIEVALPNHGYDVTIQSDFPAGRGMGSSAALAIALVRARARAEDRPQGLVATCDQAMAVERIFHGNPSGLDHTVSARGGLIWYKKGPPMVMEPLSCPPWHVIVLDSGTAGNTAEMVQRVANQGQRATPLLDRIGEIVEEVRASLHDAKQLGFLLNENHALLDALGVSTKPLNELTEWARTKGALGAKLAGAGGGGIVIAITNDASKLLDAANSLGIPAMSASIVESSWE